MKIHIKKLKHSPFAIAAGIGLLDLSGGFISVVADLWWLTFDTVVKSPLLLEYPLAYGLVYAGLILAALLMLTGITATAYLIFKYSSSGVLDAELKCELIHRKEVIQNKKRAKVFGNTLKNKENVK